MFYSFCSAAFVTGHLNTQFAFVEIPLPPAEQPPSYAQDSISGPLQYSRTLFNTIWHQASTFFEF